MFIILSRVAQLESEYLKSASDLKNEAFTEEEALLAVHMNEIKSLRAAQEEEERRIEVEIRKLEAELESILAPTRLLSSLRKDGDQQEKRMVIEDSNAKLSELESELQCCSCLKVCCPPGICSPMRVLDQLNEMDQLELSIKCTEMSRPF